MKSSRRTRQYWRKASKKASSATNKQKPNEAPKAKIKNRLSFFENFLLLSGYGRLSPAPKEQSVIVGPINDLAFLDYPRQVDPHLCGPFNSERDASNAIRQEAQLLGV